MDPMEMSLRDINQRLKNAEREQENARRNIQDGGGAGGGGDGRGNRDGRPQQRGGRDGGRDGGNKDGYRSDRGPRRDGNRDQQPRGDGRPERQGRGGEGDGARQPFNGGREQRPFHQEDAQEGVAGGSQAPDIVANDAGMSEDQLQHGRRFTAKRRPLPDNNAGAEGAGGQEGSAGVDNVPTPDAHVEQRQEDSGAENIQFGR
jgi:hypothetical protein